MPNQSGVHVIVFLLQNAYAMQDQTSMYVITNSINMHTSRFQTKRTYMYAIVLPIQKWIKVLYMQ
jgi:2-phosphoglycerate kinase